MKSGDDLLLDAIKTSNVELTKSLLEANTDPNVKYYEPLTITYSNNTQFEMNSELGSALSFAVRDSTPAITKLLLEAKAYPDYIAPRMQASAWYERYTLLESAIIVEKYSQAITLIEGHADVNFSKIRPGSALWLATDKQNLILMKALIEAEANVNSSLAIFPAIRKDPLKLESIKMLLDAKVDVNIQNSSYNDSDTPLFNALFYPECLKLLLEHKANPNLVNDKGESAIIFAAKKTSEWNNPIKQCFDLLIEAKADLTMKTKENKTVFNVTKIRALRKYLHPFEPIKPSRWQTLFNKTSQAVCNDAKQTPQFSKS
jgi:ankyrin repeat protein